MCTHAYGCSSVWRAQASVRWPHKSFSIFIYHIWLLYVCGHICVTGCVEVGDSLQDSVLSSYQVGPGDWTHVFKFGGEHLNLSSHLTRPSLFLPTLELIDLARLTGQSCGHPPASHLSVKMHALIALIAGLFWCRGCLWVICVVGILKYVAFLDCHLPLGNQSFFKIPSWQMWTEDLLQSSFTLLVRLCDCNAEICQKVTCSNFKYLC